MDLDPNIDLTGRVLEITRVFDAPRALVFDAFADREQALKWLGPRGFVMTHLEADFRAGGAWRGCMRKIDSGEELWFSGIYREIMPNERLVFTFAFDLEHGERGLETLVTIDFEDLGNKTLMRFRQGVFDTPKNCERYRGGWESEFDQLTKHVVRP